MQVILNNDQKNIKRSKSKSIIKSELDDRYKILGIDKLHPSTYLTNVLQLGKRRQNKSGMICWINASLQLLCIINLLNCKNQYYIPSDKLY